MCFFSREAGSSPVWTISTSHPFWSARVAPFAVADQFSSLRFRFSNHRWYSYSTIAVVIEALKLAPGTIQSRYEDTKHRPPCPFNDGSMMVQHHLTTSPHHRPANRSSTDNSSRSRRNSSRSRSRSSPATVSISPLAMLRPTPRAQTTLSSTNAPPLHRLPVQLSMVHPNQDQIKHTPKLPRWTCPSRYPNQCQKQCPKRCSTGCPR